MNDTQPGYLGEPDIKDRRRLSILVGWVGQSAVVGLEHANVSVAKRVRSGQETSSNSAVGNALLGALPPGWSTWNLPSFTQGSMQAGIVSTQAAAADGVSGEHQSGDDSYEELLDVLSGNDGYMSVLPS